MQKGESVKEERSWVGVERMRWEDESESLEEWEVAILVTGKQEGGIGSSLRMFQIANCFRLKRDKHASRHVQKLQ